MRDGVLRSFWWLLQRFCKDYKAMSKHRAAEELRRALVLLQRWVLQNMVIADSDLQSQARLCELLTDCEAAAIRAGIPIDGISGELPAFGDRLRIPYTVGVTGADGKLVWAKVLQADHAWSLRIRALVKVCDGVCNDWHPQKYSANKLGRLLAKKDGVHEYSKGTITKKIKALEDTGDVNRLGERGPFQLRNGFRDELEQ